MRKIMILGAGVYQVPILEAAKKRGLFSIAISPEGNYPGLMIADKVYNIDVREKERILEIARKEKIDGVTTDQTDIAVRTVAFIAEQMGLPGIGYETSKLFTDKVKMRNKCAQLGLPTIPYREVFSYKEAESFFQELNGTAIIKPADNQGSRGISKVKRLEDLREKYCEAQSFSSSKSVIIEKFIEGTEFEVDSIVACGISETLMCGDLVSFEIKDLFASATRLYPSVADKRAVKKLLGLNKRTIEGFGLWQGLTHSEYIMDQQGEIFLVEAAARGGGTFISSHIAQFQSGLDTSDFLLEIALTHNVKMPSFEKKRHHCGYVTFYLPAGKVRSVTGVEEVKQLPFVFKHLLEDIHVGLKTEVFTDKTSRHPILLHAATREELLDNIELVKQILKIEVETLEGVKAPIWN